MNRSTVATVAALALVAAFHVAPASAQNTRSFVSGHGSDTNPCSLAQPCRTFAQAITATVAGGEIDVLDPAGYGVLTINKAISIVNDGVGTSSILVPSEGIGITINAGTTDAVHLRGLTIDGEGSGRYGIEFNTGGSLTLVNCVIRHHTEEGLWFNPSNSANLFVSNTLANDNAGGDGILIEANSDSTVNATVNRSEMNGNATGLAAQIGYGTVNVTVSGSVAAGNASSGFYAEGATFSGTVTLSLFHVVAANNQFGVAASGISATARLAQSEVTGNTNGWETPSGGTVVSYGDNYIDGNTNNQGAPPSTARK